MDKLWNTSVRVVANIPAPDGWTAARRLERALETAGFDVVDDIRHVDVAAVDVTVGAFEAEEGTQESGLPGKKTAQPSNLPWPGYMRH